MFVRTNCHCANGETTQRMDMKDPISVYWTLSPSVALSKRIQGGLVPALRTMKGTRSTSASGLVSMCCFGVSLSRSFVAPTMSATSRRKRAWKREPSMHLERRCTSEYTGEARWCDVVRQSSWCFLVGLRQWKRTVWYQCRLACDHCIQPMRKKRSWRCSLGYYRYQRVCDSGAGKKKQKDRNLVGALSALTMDRPFELDAMRQVLL